MACFFVLFCFDLCVHSITSQSCLILHLCMMFLIVRNVEGIILKKKGSTHGTHTHTSSLYTFWSCSWRGVADGGSQLFHTKLALGRHVCTKRLTITCKHTLANTHRHIWATCSPGTQLELHGVTLSPSPRTPSYPHSMRGQVSHSGSHTWIGPRCQLCLSWHTDT